MFLSRVVSVTGCFGPRSGQFREKQGRVEYGRITGHFGPVCLGPGKFQSSVTSVMCPFGPRLFCSSIVSVLGHFGPRWIKSQVVSVQDQFNGRWFQCEVVSVCGYFCLRAFLSKVLGLFCPGSLWSPESFRSWVVFVLPA